MTHYNLNPSPKFVMPDHTGNMTTTNPGHDRLWTVQEFCDYFGIKLKTAYNWRHQGYGPKSFKVGKFLRYSPTEIFRWEQELIQAENQ